jgi:ubiquinone/menaquinone biosynthesis C-methylase UbiE
MRGVEQIPWIYDAFMAVFEHSGLSRWRRWLVSGAQGSTLEVGCGTGRNLPLYPPGVRMIGLEIDRRMLMAARRRTPGVRLVVGRAEALPFRDGQFDTVVSALVFCTVQYPDVGLSEVWRVLRPAGQLRMMEHVRYPATRGKIQDLTQPVWTAIAGGCHPNRNTEAAVTKAGFEIDLSTRRARNTMRRFVARPTAGKERP